MCRLGCGFCGQTCAVDSWLRGKGKLVKQQKLHFLKVKITPWHSDTSGGKLNMVWLKCIECIPVSDRLKIGLQCVSLIHTRGASRTEWRGDSCDRCLACGCGGRIDLSHACYWKMAFERLGCLINCVMEGIFKMCCWEAKRERGKLVIQQNPRQKPIAYAIIHLL